MDMEIKNRKIVSMITINTTNKRFCGDGMDACRFSETEGFCLLFMGNRGSGIGENERRHYRLKACVDGEKMHKKLK